MDSTIRSIWIEESVPIQNCEVADTILKRIPFQFETCVILLFSSFFPYHWIPSRKLWLFYLLTDKTVEWNMIANSKYGMAIESHKTKKTKKSETYLIANLKNHVYLARYSK